MSVSTDGQLCYGILYEDCYEFPWNDSPDRDIENWWLEINGYEPPFKLYGKDGNYINGVRPTEQKVNEYYAHRRAFSDAHPLPVQLVNYCSGDCPMYIIAVPDSVVICRRGYPEEVNTHKMAYLLESARSLVEFCRKYCPKEDLTPKWWYPVIMDRKTFR